jgi:hypothetical protein
MEEELQPLPQFFQPELLSTLYIGAVKKTKRVKPAGVVEIWSQCKPFTYILALHLLGR